MAKYKSGEEAMVGDVVECLAGRRIGTRFTVLDVGDDSLYFGTPSDGWISNLFKLVSSAPSPESEQPAVTPEQSPPLVVWPEEKPALAFENLAIHELFVFADSHDSYVRQKIGDTSFVTFAFEPTNSPNGYHSTLPDRAVRRLKMVQRPQFTVI